MKIIKSIAVVICVLVVVAFIKIEGKRWLHYLNHEYGNWGWAAGMLMIFGAVVILLAVRIKQTESARSTTAEKPVEGECPKF